MGKPKRLETLESIYQFRVGIELENRLMERHLNHSCTFSDIIRDALYKYLPERR